MEKGEWRMERELRCVNILLLSERYFLREG